MNKKPAKRQTRVAHISAGELFGGVEQFIYSYADYLRRNDGSTFITILLHKGRLFEKLSAAGLPVKVVTSSFRYDPRAAFAIYRLLRRYRINLVHTHGYKASILGGLAARLAGVRLVKTEHGALEPSPTWSSLKMRLNLWLDGWLTRRLFDAVIYITNDLMRIKGLRGRRGTQVIHNGIEPVRQTKRGRSGFSDGYFHIGIVGRLSPVKGHRLLFDALTRLRPENRVHLHVLGLAGEPAGAGEAP
jgi:L-malate glycosyltransferase